MKKRSGRWSTAVLVLLFVMGLSLLLYPTVSDYYNSFHASRAIVSYTQQVSDLADDAYQTIFAEADRYNESLAQAMNPWRFAKDHPDEYLQLLHVSADGIMGYIDIPVIDVYLPVYHTTSEGVLQVGVGHIEGTSLPVGGKGTHTVLSGHRGLPSARLFTDLDKLVEGDTFLLHILDETLTYQVDQILIVEPEDVSALEIQPDQDLCTLVTCTPYGINSHRILVRGHRIETAAQTPQVRVTGDAIQVEPVIVAVALAVPVLLMLLAAVLITTGKRR